MTRLKLARALAAPLPSTRAIEARIPDDGDRAILGEILYLAYLGGPDQEENDAIEGRAEIDRTMNGHYGPYLPAASFVTSDEEGVVGASLVVMHLEHVLLAHAVVHPRAQGRGLGAALVTKSLAALAAEGHREVLLAVHAESRAKGLYERLGFVHVP